MNLNESALIESLNDEIVKKVGREDFDSFIAYVEERLVNTGNDEVYNEITSLRSSVKSVQKVVNDSLNDFKREVDENQEVIANIQQSLADKVDRLELKNHNKETDRKLAAVALEYKKIYEKLDNQDREVKKTILTFKKELRDRMGNFLKCHKEDESKLRDQIDELVKAQNDFKAHLFHNLTAPVVQV